MTEIEAPRRRKRIREPRHAEVSLGDWGARGSTRTNLDGVPALVDRGVPGELVRASFDTPRRPWRGVVEEVVRPSPHRVDPPCPYYLAGCGGCQWQHLGYDAQLQAKRDLVESQLAGAGVEARVGAVRGMEGPWRYRRTAAIAVGWEAGFRPRGRRGIVEIHDCLISHPLIGRLADGLNGLLRAGRLPNYHGKVWLDCTVVGPPESEGLQVVLQGASGLTLETHPELPEVARILASLDGVASVAYRHRSGQPVPLVGSLIGEIEVAGQILKLPAGSFSQTNLPMLDLLIARIQEIISGRPIRTAADVYGGAGTFAFALAPAVEEMTLIELDPGAVEAARHTATARGAENVRFVADHAERALRRLPTAPDLVIVDPPRCGLGEVVIGALGQQQPRFLIYVSCAPPSLARDLAALQDLGYRVSLLELFDFYPQTYHVESLAFLER